MAVADGHPNADASSFRARVGELKAQLADHPEDEGTRRELVEEYRATGHLDQSGRYGIAVDGLATPEELRAYGAMLRGLGAHDERLRNLSRLPEGAEISNETREALDARSPSEGVLDSALPVLWLIVFVSIVAALLATFFSALAGNASTQGVAVVLSTIVVTLALIASACTALWAATEKFWKSATIWALIAAVLLSVGLLLLLR